MTNTIIDAKVTSIELLEVQIKELKSLVDAIKEELKNELDIRKVELIDTGINRIHYDIVEKHIIDTKKLESDGLYNNYLKESISTRFAITHRQEK